MLPPCGERFYYSRWIVSTRSHTRTKTTLVLSTTSIYWSDLNQITCVEETVYKWQSDRVSIFTGLFLRAVLSLLSNWVLNRHRSSSLKFRDTHALKTKNSTHDDKDTMVQISPFSRVSWIATDWSMVWRRQRYFPVKTSARLSLCSTCKSSPYIPFSGRAKVRLRCGSAQSNIIPFFWAPPDVSPLDPWLPRTPSESFGEPTLTSHVGVHLPLSRSTRPAPRCWLIQADYSPKSVVWVD